MAAAHREGIIHRDLKPGNIMRDMNGRVVVMDFGLARTISGDGMTRTGAMLGTMEYMSPEQAQGKELKASSDVFTFGLILYELVAGVMPFHAESAIASLLMRTQQRAVPLSDVDKNIPGTLSNIVAKCLEKEPRKPLPERGRTGCGSSRVAKQRRKESLCVFDAAAHESPAGASLAASRGHRRSDSGDRDCGLAWFVIRRQQAAKSGRACPSLGAGGRLCESYRRPGSG